MNAYYEQAELSASTIRDYNPRIRQILEYFRQTEGIQPDVSRQ